jgi:hypothetical protein
VAKYFTTETEWHDIRIDPLDLPSEDEPILITIETFSGDRKVWMDAYLKSEDEDNYWFCTKAVNEFGYPEETVVWYPVIAWAYPPDPFDLY